MGGVLSGANQTVSVVNNGVTSAREFTEEQVSFMKRFLRSAVNDRELIDAIKNLAFPEAQMRRMIVALVLTICALTTYFIVHYRIADTEEEKDNVVFTKQVIFGDAGLMNYVLQTMVFVSMFFVLRRALKVMSSSAVVALQTKNIPFQMLQSVVAP